MLFFGLSFYVVIPVMIVHSDTQPTSCQAHTNASSQHKTTQEERRSSLTENISNVTRKVKAHQNRRKSVAGKSNATRVRRKGLTTRRATPHVGQDLVTADEYVTSDILERSIEREDTAKSREARRAAVLKKLQENITGFYRDLPFPYTDHAYIIVFNTLMRDTITLWKNATRDFTELRRVYVKESRSLHVGESFTAYRRQGTHFYTVLGFEGWDGNIIEYPDYPYKYKKDPGSEFSVRTEEVETRDPRVWPFTEGESRYDLDPRYRFGRRGEWMIDWPNEPYVSAGPERVHWPYRWRERDPPNATIPMYNFATFEQRDRKRRDASAKRKRRGTGAVKRKRRGVDAPRKSGHGVT